MRSGTLLSQFLRAFLPTFGEMSSDVRHSAYFSGGEDRHEYEVGFLVHKT